MKRVPDSILTSQSGAELRVHELFADVQLGQGWTVYHSLNCSEHEYKRWCEVDFFVLGPDIALVIEVKGGRIRREAGEWVFTNRYDRETRRREGPFDQARSAMYALKKALYEKSTEIASDLDDLVFGWCVLFPDVLWQDYGPETPQEITGDARHTRDAGAFEDFLRGCIRYWREKERHERRATRELLRALERVIRPDVDLYPAVSFRIGAVLHRMQALTEEQYERLDLIETNSRVVVTGGAGTGKTHLMVQAARLAARRGAHVLIAVESPILAAHIERVVSVPGLEVMTVKAIEHSGVVFDELFVDEGQDLLEIDTMDQIFSRVRGGFDNGRWVWFMDVTRQSGLRGTMQEEALQLLRAGGRSGSPVAVHLRMNLRNTRQITQFVGSTLDVDVGVPARDLEGRSPQVHEVASVEAAVEALVEILTSALEDGIEPGDIGFIRPDDMAREIERSLPRRIRSKFLALDARSVAAAVRGRMCHGSAASFKGLERPMIVWWGFGLDTRDQRCTAEAYVSMTRANAELHLIVDSGNARFYHRKLVDAGLRQD